MQPAVLCPPARTPPSVASEEGVARCVGVGAGPELPERLQPLAACDLAVGVGVDAGKGVRRIAFGDPEGRHDLDELGGFEGAVPALVGEVEDRLPEGDDDGLDPTISPDVALEGLVVLLAADAPVLVEVHTLEVAGPEPADSLHDGLALGGVL